MLDYRKAPFQIASRFTLVLLQADEALEVFDRHFLLEKTQAEMANRKKKNIAASSMNSVLNWKTLNLRNVVVVAVAVAVAVLLLVVVVVVVAVVVGGGASS